MMVREYDFGESEGHFWQWWFMARSTTKRWGRLMKQGCLVSLLSVLLAMAPAMSRAVVAGKFDLSFASRLPKPKNQAKGLSGVPLLRTPFVLAVSDQVGGQLDLSSDKLLKVFDRKAATWPDVSVIETFGTVEPVF
jgi:hypothetical protein